MIPVEKFEFVHQSYLRGLLNELQYRVLIEFLPLSGNVKSYSSEIDLTIRELFTIMNGFLVIVKLKKLSIIF
jgi:hypothetical protein